MTLQSSTLRPGLLVSLRTSINGNISYTKQTIEADHVTTAGEARAKWETTRTIADPAEYALAEKARNKASSLIRGVCANSAFGLLCPEADADQLEAAIAEARAAADAFNRAASLSRVAVHVITGRIAPNDVEAVRAINSELRGLLDDMAAGIQRLDVKEIREAASRAKALGVMLPSEVASRIKDAIDAARSAARKITKAGEQAAQEIDTKAVRAITEARTAFLDLDEAGEVQAPEETGTAIDLTPSEPQAMAAAGYSSPSFDFI